MIKSKSNTEFNKSIDESKEFKIDEQVNHELLDIKIHKNLTREDKNILIEKLRKEIDKEDKKNEEKAAIKRSSSKWSFCIFCQSEAEDTIDISDKPDFSKRRIKK